MKHAWLFFTTLIFLFVFCKPVCAATMADPFDGKEADEWLVQVPEEERLGLTMKDLMKKMAAGEFEAVFYVMAEKAGGILFDEIRTNAGILRRILFLSVLGALLTSFSSAFGSGTCAETSFYVIDLLMLTFLMAGFSESIDTAGQILSRIAGFMKMVLPAYLTAVAVTGGTLTSAGLTGISFAVISMVETIFSGILLPLIKVFLVFTMMGNLYRENMMSRFTDLLKKVIIRTVKVLSGLVIGFELVQGMVLPNADLLRNSTILNTMVMIPGFGARAGAFSRVLLGSGVLIRNTAGAATAVIIFALAAVPVIRLMVIAFLYSLTAALMQPVCDRRLTEAVAGAAEGYSLLIRIIGTSVLLLILTMGILCVSSNAVI